MNYLRKGKTTKSITDYYNSFKLPKKDTKQHSNQQASGEWQQCVACTGTDCWCYVTGYTNAQLNQMTIGE